MADLTSQRPRPSSADQETRHIANPTVSVVVPCMNEERNLPYFFSRMPAEVDEVVLVDGRSVDRTVERARELWPSVRIVNQTRRGKGNALACGFLASTGDIVVMIDADGSTDPAEIPLFVEALRKGSDFAKGSRFMDGGGSHDITWIRKLGNAGLSMFVNRLFGTKYSDLCYGYNAFWRDTLPHMDLPDINQPLPAGQSMLWGDGFEIETLVNVRVAGVGLKITEVPSFESARIHGVSNLNALADGRRVLRTIMSEYRSRDRRRSLAAAANQPTTPLEYADRVFALDAKPGPSLQWSVTPTSAMPAMVPVGTARGQATVAAALGAEEL